MKCPYLKITRHMQMPISSTDTIDVEDFGDCYGKACPHFESYENREYCQKAEAQQEGRWKS